MSLSSIIPCNSFKETSGNLNLVFWSCLLLAINLMLKQTAIAAPENFNPELQSPPESESKVESTAESRERDRQTASSSIESSSQQDPQTVIPKSNTSAPTAEIPLPTPSLPSESSITSGTADIELEAKPDTDRASSPSTLKIDNITFDFELSFDNFGQTNQFMEEAIAFNLYNQSFELQTGINFFEQDDVEKVDNIPLYLTWETEVKGIDLAVTGGVDFFDRLPTVPTVTLKASSPLFSTVTADGKLKSLFVLSGQAQYQAYKFNAETLENEIDFWRFTPSIYWQITPSLSLFSLGQYGIFNDGNRELQSFSRIERKLGAFSIAANLFTWDFEQDLSMESGYFSPSGFLVYNGEIAWQGTMFDEVLDCKLSAAYGKQQLDGVTDNAWTYQALCEAQLLPNVILDLGYTYSNVRDRATGDTNFSNQTIKGKLDIEL